jgi:ribose transport system ATP-binding protein
MSQVLLEMRGIRKSYPGVIALDRVDLKVEQGEIHGLMGENGAGKSTLIKVLAGAISPDAGEILFDGRSYPGFDPRSAIDAGIGVIYQEFNLVPALSVAENIFLGHEFMRAGLTDSRKARQSTRDLFGRLQIDIDPDTPVRELTVAYQQIVEIAKAVSRQVKLLVMDEPTAPLSNREVLRLFELVARLKMQGIAIIYISHRLEEIFKLTENVTVIRDGRYISTVKTSETTRAELVAMMVGRQLSETYPEGRHASVDVALEVRALSAERFKDVSFKLQRGEILGIAGLVGAGRTEIARAIFGADPITGGEIFVDGKKVAIRSPQDAIRAGIALIPEDRKAQGLLLNMSVRENATMAALKGLATYGLLHMGREKAVVEGFIKKLRIRTPSVDQKVKLLSGGNQQKVVVAKWLQTFSKIIIFDEPTRGVDVGAKHEIYRLMRELTAEGISIIMISSEMPELIGISDRILVLSRGRIAGDLAAGDFSQDRILELAAG